MLWGSCHKPRVPSRLPVLIKRRGKKKTNGKTRPEQVSCPRGGRPCRPLTLLKPGGHVAQDVGRVQNLGDIVPEGVQIPPLLGRHACGWAPAKALLTSAPLSKRTASRRRFFRMPAGRGSAAGEILTAEGKSKAQLAERGWATPGRSLPAPPSPRGFLSSPAPCFSHRGDCFFDFHFILFFFFFANRGVKFRLNKVHRFEGYHSEFSKTFTVEPLPPGCAGVCLTSQETAQFFQILTTCIPTRRVRGTRYTPSKYTPWPVFLFM